MATSTTPNTDTILLSINTDKMAGSDKQTHVMSPIDEYIVLECAAIVCGILGDADSMKVCQQAIQDKLAAVLQ